MDRKASSNVRRAGEILLALGDAGPQGSSLSALADRLGDARSAVHRALSALAEHGLVAQSGRRGNYRIGPAIYALANRTPTVANMVATFRPALIGISAETRLSSYLMVRSGLDSICLDYEVGGASVQALFEGIGGRLPLGVGLAGVCVLAQMDTGARERILELNEARYAQWGVDRSVIRQEIEMFRRRGYVAGSRMSDGRELVTIAFPAPAEDFDTEAAISLLAAPADFDDRMLLEAIQIAGKYIPHPAHKSALY